MAVTVYRKSDASSPSFTNVAGSIITVLDAVLVDGYGAKAAAGWTKQFSGTNEAVYKMAAGGSDAVLYVKDTDTWNCFYTKGTSGLHAAESASALNTHVHTFPFGFRNSATSVQPGIAKPDSTTDPADWVIIANGHAFYLLTRRTAWQSTNGDDLGRVWAVFFFGDVIPLGSEDPLPVIGGTLGPGLSDNATTLPSAVYSLAASTNNPNSNIQSPSLWVAGNRGGFETGGVGICTTWAFGTTHQNARFYKFNDPHVSGPVFMPVYLENYIDSTYGYDSAVPRFRMPGLYRNVVNGASGTGGSNSSGYPSTGDDVSFTFASGLLNGKTIRNFNFAGSHVNGDTYVWQPYGIETSDTWGN